MSKEHLLTITYYWIGLAVIIFLINLFIKAPYGRHSTNTWGPMISNKMGWLLMEVPALVMFPLLVFLGNGSKGIVVILAVGCWLLHYIHRTLIYPFRIRTKGKKMPLFIVTTAIIFNCINGLLMGYYVGNYMPQQLQFTKAYILIGLLLFLVGIFINIKSDTRLLHLRNPKEKGYKIPYGGLFRFVSCPNFLGEIIEWAGFAILVFSAPTLGFFVWTIANLIPRALAHHKWYKTTFPNYPKKRKALIPFVL